MDINVTRDNSFTSVHLGGLTLHFSYETLIGLETGAKKLVRKNDWSTTTGKHLNRIEPDKDARLPGEDFERLATEILDGMELKV